MVGAAIGATLADFSEFDRKNYFYPDIPKAYQISQYAYPLVTGGEIGGVAITRIHLEEDTARSQHTNVAGSHVDFNRAGVPLMELVTEPVIHSAAEAGVFARELQLLLQTLGVSHANMERGEMRVEANISVSKNDTLGTKVEVKNLNSFKVMEATIAYETKRQTEVLESGGILLQETRGWDEAKSVTYSQRSKESANDYRYFPDPDIPKYQFAKIPHMNISRLNENMPTLPSIIRSRYRDLGISEEQIEIIINSKVLQPYVWSLVDRLSNLDSKVVKLAANYLSSDVMSLVVSGAIRDLDTAHAYRFVALMELLAHNTINSRTAKDLLIEVVSDGVDPEKIATARGLLQQSNAESLKPIVDQVLAEHAEVVAEYRAGKEASLKFLVGQGMKASKGAANPQVLEDLLKKNIA
jgi:aspartyl-tRNA(Asn)/glutamyl-tRNA(Gln) amidotransferase subunit B